MAYRFNSSGAGSRVQFALPSALSSYGLGAITVVAFIKRASTADFQSPLFISNSTGGTRRFELLMSSGSAGLNAALGATETHVLPMPMDTTNWWIIAVTCAGAVGTSVPRFHVHDGTAWTHSNQSSGVAHWGDQAGTVTISPSDLLFVSPGTAWGGDYMNGDAVCVGLKKADSTDLQIETLTRTAFATWLSFGFDWLAGFETSGTVVNRSNPGSGDETSRASVSLVADPPGWVWVTTPAALSPAGGAITAATVSVRVPVALIPAGTVATSATASISAPSPLIPAGTATTSATASISTPSPVALTATAAASTAALASLATPPSAPALPFMLVRRTMI